MPTPTFDQLCQFREDYVDSWNQGDKERFAATWRQFLADDDAFRMFDPVGTPMKRGLVGCALGAVRPLAAGGALQCAQGDILHLRQ